MGNKYGVKAKKMGKDAAYSIRMSLISGLELISDSTVEYVQSLQEEAKKSKDKSPSKIPHDEIIKRVQTVRANSTKVVDRFLKFCLGLILLRVFKYPLTKIVLPIVLLPFRFFFAIIWVVTFPIRALFRFRR